MSHFDVLFAGGGYAAVFAAHRLARAGLSVAVVDARPHFTHRVRLYEVAVGHGTGQRPWAEALPPEARFFQGRVTRLGAGGAEVEGHGAVEAEHVVLATGSRSRVVWSGPTVLPLETPAEVMALRDRVATSDPRVVVIGAGATGLEFAAALCEARPGLDLTLVDPSGLPGLSEAGAARAEARLRRLGVKLRTARVLAVSPEAVETSTGSLPADLVLPCPGFEAPPLARDSGLRVDPSGRALVDDAFNVPGQPGLFAIGDAAALPTQPHVGRGCAVAMPMGAHLADNLLRLRRGDAPRPFRFAWFLKQIALGRRGGLIQGLSWDGQPTWALSGRWVGWTKAGINAAASDFGGWERRAGRSLYAWAQPPRDALLLES